MSGTFDSRWLALREKADHRARAEELVDALRAWWAGRGAQAILDLGSGTGSNLRYLAGRMPTPQRWTLVDHDHSLLDRVRAIAGDVVVHTIEGDLADVGLTEVRRADLVTASALLDLVSERWLAALADACAEAHAGALFTLVYDGTIEWSPADPGDALVREAVNEHQLRDKGLGPALGPGAARVAEELFRARGYVTLLAPSPWRLGPSDAALIEALVSGWASAAAEQRPGRADEVRAWAERRRAAAAAGKVALEVGHQDLLALLPDSIPENG